MFIKNIKLILIILLFYQSSANSKSTSFKDFNSNTLSKYFSGIVAFENKDNAEALNFFNSSKILLSRHDPYLKRYVSSLVLEKKVSQAINSSALQEKLTSNWEHAQSLGVIGVPSFVIGEEIFWGNDRFDFVLEYLREN